MLRKNMSVIFYVIIGLAIIGFIANIFTNPSGLFKSIFMMLGIGVAIFAVFYLFLSKGRVNDDEMKKYKQAVKQSKIKYNRTSNKPRQTRPVKIKNKRASHLRVIEGNKSKRKNRATF